jgi:hypothetical protein
MKTSFIVLCLLLISLTAAQADVTYSKRNKTLSVSSEGEDLVGLLYDIMEKTGIHMEIAEGVEGTVYDDFQGLSIEDGLKRILKMQNYSFIYDDGSLKKIYVFSGGATEPSGTAPSPSIVKPFPRTR